MALGPATAVINGQRFDLPKSQAYYPTAFGPQTQGVPQVSPTLPPFLGGSPSSVSSSVYASVGGYGTADNNTFATAIAAAHPFNWKVSPVLWWVLGLVLSLLLLQKIHWRRTILSGDEELNVLGARERAEASD